MMRCFVDPPTIFLYKDTIDFRKSINGLSVVIEQELVRSAFEPALYVFCNRTRDKLKILYWIIPALHSGTNVCKRRVSNGQQQFRRQHSP